MDFQKEFYICEKPIGKSPSEVLQDFKKTHPFPINKICCSGRLDPMARGKLLILINENCKNIPIYNKKNKTYEFSFIPCVSTDTTDVLGLVDDYINLNIDDNINYNIINNLKHFDGLIYEQEYHKFSSNRVLDVKDNKKKPLFYFSANNIDVQLPKKTVKIYNMDFMYSDIISRNKFNDLIFENISSLSEDNKKKFRYNMIVDKWNDYFEYSMNNYVQYTCKTTVSSGVYIRQIVKDLSKKLNIPLITTDIHRTDFYL